MAGRLTVQERAQIAACYEVWRSIIAVQRWWRNIKERHAQINPRTIKNCHAKLMTTGSVSDTQRSGRPSKFKDPEVVQVVQEMFSGSPQKSIRKAARESGLSFRCVCNVLKRRAWKPHYCQALSAEDCDIRMEFGEMMLAWLRDWPDLLKNILWSDEAVFHIGGFVNRHNCHYWAEDPRVTSEKNQNE